MGVPAFFRWLSRKYPSVIIECNENKQVDPDTNENIYEDSTLPNPNGVEFDNLYLDMNGIIHPCTHPEDKPAPKNEDEMMTAIFDCIDRLFAIVRPRKLLYMAIDGVAPRAKMNQQRSRRFRAAKESVEKQIAIERIRNELLERGCKLPPESEQADHFDSNCITPGTPFMDRLSNCLHYYIHERLNNNPAWKNIKVILSDANVPGEGEHKIMDFIRKQRAQPDHDPNTHHVLCGADADLIMLGLATHEPNFTIIREEFLPNKPRPCEVCHQFGHEMDKCVGLNNSATTSSFTNKVAIGSEVKYIFVRLSVLREYLKKTLEMPNLPFAYNFERVLDDWVFMCFFVGNDFLPHLPSLEIREGAVDRLVELYKKCVYKTGGYLTNSGDVSLERVQLIMTDLGKAEDQIFKERQRREQQYKAREMIKRKREEKLNHDDLVKSSVFGPSMVDSKIDSQHVIVNYKQEAASLRNIGKLKRTNSDANLNDDSEEISDEVRLWEDGFKDRYYEAKFDVDKGNLGFRYSVALQYVRGLCWVLKYYYQGCASWNWYFPYHYAPFASDFVNIQGLSTTFEKGTKPFKPLEQLMGVFPAASSSHVPQPWAKLMSDPQSNIIDFYPEDFKIDLNGKKFAWQGVALLPFVDEKRLCKALNPYYEKLTEEEVRRNKQGDTRLYVGAMHSQFKRLKSFYENGTLEVDVSMDGMRGKILKFRENVPLQKVLVSPIPGLKNVENNEVITVRFRDPEYGNDFVFAAVRLSNAVDPPSVLPTESRNIPRPVIGFNPNVPQAHISASGYRFINSSLRRENNLINRNEHNSRNGYNNLDNYYARRSEYQTYRNNQQSYEGNLPPTYNSAGNAGNRYYNGNNDARSSHSAQNQRRFRRF